MINFNNLTKRFGQHIAVENLNMRIRAGELFGFLGPNGAGKTTTIKMMTGILKPTSGKIEIAGFDVQRQPQIAKMKVGYVPDEPYLYDRLTAREYLEFVAGLYRLDRKTLDIRSAELFETFGMDGWLDRKCEEYSHGMRQKVVFCAALLHNPAVLVVDEPIVGLDPQSTRLVKDLLKRYAAAGKTVFISTHVLSVAEELCDRIGIIDHGKLIGLGSIAELKAKAAQDDINLETLFLSLTAGQG